MTHRVASTNLRPAAGQEVSHLRLSPANRRIDERGDGPVDELAVRAGRVLLTETVAVAIVGGVTVAIQRLSITGGAVKGETALNVGHLGLIGLAID